MTTIAAFMISSAIMVNAQDLGTIDPVIKGQMATMLTKYYGIKDALVDSNAETASTSAGELVSTLEALDDSKMTGPQKTLWEKLRALIRTDAVHINRNKEIGHQREHMMKLSNNMYALVANFKANTAEAYFHYCPMKKASWLSDSKDVKNPYYGSKMLKCGAVKATLSKN
jgi:hypothetical protein